MTTDDEWYASALCLAEARVTLCQLSLDEAALSTMALSLRSDWERFYVVPLDDPCVARAAEIGCAHRVRTLDALHLAAADRLPRPTDLRCTAGESNPEARARRRRDRSGLRPRWSSRSRSRLVPYPVTPLASAVSLLERITLLPVAATLPVVGGVGLPSR